VGSEVGWTLQAPALAIENSGLLEQMKEMEEKMAL
jgi:hypothetical protein